MDWRHRAACRDEDPELFFPVGNSGPALLQIAEAKTVCRRCPVVSGCLSWALETGQSDGVWGGMSEQEREALKRRNARTRQRAKQPAAPEPVEERGPQLLLKRDGEPLAAPARGVGHVVSGNRLRWHAAGVDGRSMCGTSLLDVQNARLAETVLERDRCGNHACRKVWRQVDEKLAAALVAALQAAVQQVVSVEETVPEPDVPEVPVEPAAVAPAVAEASPGGRQWHPLNEPGLPACGVVTSPATRRLARSVEHGTRCRSRGCRQLWAKLDADMAVSRG